MKSWMKLESKPIDIFIANFASVKAFYQCGLEAKLFESSYNPVFTWKFFYDYA